MKKVRAKSVAPFTGAWIEMQEAQQMQAQQAQVAPFTGAWIEISMSLYTSWTDSAAQQAQVAPFTGAWIEICGCKRKEGDSLVAPFTGAWIEISGPQTWKTSSRMSHPSRVRGLKFLLQTTVN